MSLTDTQSTLLSFWLSGPAADFTAADRNFARGELNLIIEDKIMIAARKFGRKVTMQAKPAAIAFLDAMIAKGAWSTRTNDFGGTMHAFQSGAYKPALEEMKADDALAVEGEGKDADFWTAKFEALTAA